MLPGPWQDSQPTLDTVSPLASSRAWAAERKLRTISAWQSAQVDDPTNFAPGTSGGTNTVRDVAQDSAIAAKVPAPNAIADRFPIRQQPDPSRPFRRNRILLRSSIMSDSSPTGLPLPAACPR